MRGTCTMLIPLGKALFPFSCRGFSHAKIRNLEWLWVSKSTQEETAALDNLWLYLYHCPYAVIQYSSNPQKHGNTHTYTETNWPFLRLWPASRLRCLQRWEASAMDGNLSLHRMVGQWRFNKDQCKFSIRERRRCLGICLRAITSFTLSLTAYLPCHTATLFPYRHGAGIQILVI